jgi:predicted transcriptional regulator
MKTTIDFPDELLHRVKVIAAERRTTLKDLMVQALRHITEPPPEVVDKERKETFRRLLREMKASNTEPMNPLARNDAHDR